MGSASDVLKSFGFQDEEEENLRDKSYDDYMDYLAMNYPVPVDDLEEEFDDDGRDYLPYDPGWDTWLERDGWDD
jgi:hypothetical protein